MRVLLIEDDSNIAQSIELMLKSESFNVHTTDFGEDGVDLGKVYDYDIILLDLNLPDISGFDVLRALRVSKVKTPILILSGRAGIEDKVRGLGYGADDYMTKPFHKDELVARIHAIARRSREQQPAPFRMPADCESARHRRAADAARNSRRGHRVRRRDFFPLVGSAATWPLVASAAAGGAGGWLSRPGHARRERRKPRGLSKRTRRNELRRGPQCHPYCVPRRQYPSDEHDSYRQHECEHQGES